MKHRTSKILASSISALLVTTGISQAGLVFTTDIITGVETDRGTSFTIDPAVNDIDGEPIDNNFLRINNVLVLTGGTFTAPAASGNVFGQTPNATTIDINGGTFIADRSVFLGNGGSGSNTFTITSGLADFNGTVGIARDGATSLLDIQGGVVDITNDLDFRNGSAGNSGVNGLIDLSGGELIVGGSIIDVDGNASSFEGLFNDGFLLSGGQGVDDGLVFANVFTVDAATGTLAVVPEPSSAALLGLGGLALIMRRRK